MTKVIIINGRPQSGKDTIIRYMMEYCDSNEVALFTAISTIDPVKSALKSLGWNGEKDVETRNMLSNLKDWWIKNSNGPIKYCYKTITSIVESGDRTADDNLIVIQVRERQEIEKLRSLIDSLGFVFDISVMKLIVNRPSLLKEHYGNDSDDCVENCKYDAAIDNIGSLGDLRTAVDGLMDILFKVNLEVNLEEEQ